jgi:hypothetical protein
MSARFESDGVGFLYPENWDFNRVETESGWTVSVQSPETAFLMVSYDAEMPDAELMADTALDALRSEYPGRADEPAVEPFAGQRAVGHDVRFFSLDLTNTCWMRSFYSGTGTVLVFWQANDLELDRVGPVLRAICASLTVDEE